MERLPDKLGQILRFDLGDGREIGITPRMFNTQIYIGPLDAEWRDDAW